MHSIHSRVINRRYTRRCCNRHETLNVLLLSGAGDGREIILQTQAESFDSLNIRSQFSNNTGLLRKELIYDGRTYHIISFYFHLLLSFPNFFPTFPLSESYRDIVLCVIDASRRQRMVDFGPNNVLANVLYNDRYYHYARKCLHLVGFQCLYRLASFWNRSLDPSCRGRDKSRV